MERESYNIDRLNSIIGGKENARMILIYKGLHLPPNKSRIISKEFLSDVITGATYCPLSKDLELRQLLQRVRKYDLVEAILAKKPKASAEVWSSK